MRRLVAAAGLSAALLASTAGLVQAAPPPWSHAHLKSTKAGKPQVPPGQVRHANRAANASQPAIAPAPGPGAGTSASAPVSPIQRLPVAAPAPAASPPAAAAPGTGPPAAQAAPAPAASGPAAAAPTSAPQRHQPGAQPAGPGPARNPGPSARAASTAAAVLAMVLGLVHHVQVGVNPASLLIGLLLLSAALLLVLVARRRQLDRERQTSLAAALGVDAHQLSGVGSAQAEVILSRVSAVTSRLRLLEGRASFDELTGVLRRGPGIAALERDIARARRSPDQRLTVAFIDVDGLKRVNDSDGHAAGDRLLQGVAAALQTRLRGEDLVFRYGGDEFVCVLPHSDVEAAAVTLQQVRGTLAHQAGDAGFSVGLASLRDGDDAHSLIARADADLYTGRRRRTT